MAEMPRSQCRGPGFDPCSGNLILHASAKTWHRPKQKNIKKKKEDEGPSSSPETPFPTLSPPPSGDRIGGVLEELECCWSRVLEPVTWGLWLCQLLPEG